MCDIQPGDYRRRDEKLDDAFAEVVRQISDLKQQINALNFRMTELEEQQRWMMKRGEP